MENRRDLLRLAAVSALAGIPLSASGTQIPDAVRAASEAAVTKHRFGEERVYFEGATGQLKTMKAGSVLLHAGQEPHPAHQHPEEEFMLVTEGNGEIVVAGAAKKVGPGAMVYCEGNKMHGIKNTGTAPMVFYFYKWQG